MTKKIKNKILWSFGAIVATTIPLNIVACSTTTKIELTKEEGFAKYLKENITKTDLEQAVNFRVSNLEKMIKSWNSENANSLKIKIIKKEAKMNNFDTDTKSFSYEITFNTELQGVKYIRVEKATNQQFEVKEDVQGSKQVGFNISMMQTNSRITKATSERTFNVSAKNFLTKAFLDKTTLDDFDKDNLLVKGIKINHSNDIHGRISENPGRFSRNIGMENLAAYFNTNKPDLLLDGGDFYQGTGESNQDNGFIASQIASAIGYDGIAAGNHEFDFGTNNLVKNAKIAPFYSGNTIFKTTISDSNQIKGDLLLPGTRIKTIKGDLQVGLIPLTTEDTAVKSNPLNTPNLKWENIIEAARKQMAILKAMGINLIIVYGHLGDEATSVRTSLQLAEALSDIDLIIDGHSHQKYDLKRKINETYLVQTGAYSQYLGEMSFDFNKETGKIENFNNFYTDLTDFTKNIKNNLIKNEEVDKLVKTALNNYAKFKDVEAFKFNTDLADSVVLEKKGTPVRTTRNFEGNLANFYADSLQWYAETKTVSKGKKIIGIQNGGGIRAGIDIKNGIVTQGQIFEVSPFNNTFLTLEATGKDLKEIFDLSAKAWGDGGFLQVSKDLEVSYELNQIAEDSTDSSLLNQNKVTLIKYKGVEIKDDDEFVIATNDFLRAGGDGYKILKTLKEIANGDVLTKVLIDFGNALPTLSDYNVSNYSKVYIKPNEATRIKIKALNSIAQSTLDKFNAASDSIELQNN